MVFSDSAAEFLNESNNQSNLDKRSITYTLSIFGENMSKLVSNQSRPKRTDLDICPIRSKRNTDHSVGKEMAACMANGKTCAHSVPRTASVPRLYIGSVVSAMRPIRRWQCYYPKRSPSSMPAIPRIRQDPNNLNSENQPEKWDNWYWHELIR